MNTRLSIRWLICAAVGLAATASAISPVQVRQLLDSGEKITFVDVRLNNLFQKGHIPNAVNIPAQLVPEKQLPPLGHVVVYDGGLGENDAQAAVAALNQKNGITAEVLDGGYAAWEMAQSSTTKSGGMKPEEAPVITYAELKKTQSADVVLVDLRRNKPAVTANAIAATNAPPAPLTDLQTEFPGDEIVHSPFEASASPVKNLAGGTAPTPPLLILIDNGDGRAQAMARALKANGVTRFAILAGGEQILSVHGQPGLQRIGSSVTVRQSSANAP